MPPKQVRERARGWCFTIYESHGDWEDLEEHAKHLRETPVDGEKFIVFQKEIAPDTGREHLQGYIHMEKATDKHRVVALLGGAHLERAAGSVKQNYEYCTKAASRKPGTIPFERGDKDDVGQGRRSDIAEAAAVAREPNGFANAVAQFPPVAMKYSKGLQVIANQGMIGRQQAFRDVKVMVFWGDPGTGKSWWANMVYDTGYTYRTFAIEKGQKLWWDGYEERHRTIVIDEFDGSLSYRELLRMMDGYQDQGQVKGSFVPFFYDHIVITSNTRPDEWYNEDDWDNLTQKRSMNTKSPLARRIDQIWHCTGQWDKTSDKGPEEQDVEYKKFTGYGPLGQWQYEKHDLLPVRL